MNTENVSVTAGIGGFLAFFVLALALWLLMRNMFARLRRMRYREEARIEAERRAAGLDAEGEAPGEAGDEADDPDPGAARPPGATGPADGRPRGPDGSDGSGGSPHDRA